MDNVNSAQIKTDQNQNTGAATKSSQQQTSASAANQQAQAAESKTSTDQPKDSSVAPNEQDPLKALLGMVGEGKEVKDIKRKNKYIIEAPKLNNFTLTRFVENLRNVGREDDYILNLIIKLDRLIEKGEVDRESLLKMGKEENDGGA